MLKRQTAARSLAVTLEDRKLLGASRHIESALLDILGRELPLESLIVLCHHFDDVVFSYHCDVSISVQFWTQI